MAFVLLEIKNDTFAKSDSSYLVDKQNQVLVSGATSAERVFARPTKMVASQGRTIFPVSRQKYLKDGASAFFAFHFYGPLAVFGIFFINSKE